MGSLCFLTLKFTWTLNWKEFEMFDSILNEPYYTMDNTFPLGICGREAKLRSNEKIVQQ